MHVLVFGGGGQVGTELRALPKLSDIDIVAPPRSTVDLEDHRKLSEIIAAKPWSAVVNASGYTNVDAAEGDMERAFGVNAEAVVRLGTETARLGIPLVHISTDYIFDGKKGRPYVESDKPSPINVYGRTKLAGEQGLQRVNPRHIILRTSWVYSPFGKNFVKTILRLAQSKEQIGIVADQIGCPTTAHDVAKISLALALTCGRQPDDIIYGVYHCAGPLHASWFEFANAIIDLARSRLRTVPQIIPLRTEEYPTAAARPADSRLDSTTLFRAFNLSANSWRAALPKTIERLFSEEG